ncbi:MAG: hypothetical protein ACKVVP_02415 [Chloroflexota bacterium]
MMRLKLMTFVVTAVVLIIPFIGAPPASAQVSPPERRCADLLACEAGEINHAYTVQYESGCGANCSISYWVRDRVDGRVLIAVTEARGGVVIGVRGLGSAAESHPDVRVIAPRYASGDPRCCPAGISDTRYTWNTARATLVIAEERVIPFADADLEALSAEMQAQGYILYFNNRP